MSSFTVGQLAAWLGILALLVLAETRLASSQTRPAADTKSESPVVITDVTVIDVVTGAHRTGVGVLIQGGKITSIGSRIKIPPGATRLRGKGKFLIPGLWDMHSHHQGTPVKMRLAVRQARRQRCFPDTNPGVLPNLTRCLFQSPARSPVDARSAQECLSFTQHRSEKCFPVNTLGQPGFGRNPTRLGAVD